MNNDHIIREILNILNCQSEFILDFWFQINGQTQKITIQPSYTTTNNFLYDYKNQRILHFTNLNSAIAILKSKKLRSSNLSAFANKGGDKEELNHGLRLTHNLEADYATLKDHIFVTSFTPLENSDLSSYDFHWKSYGDNFKGVALEFEIIRTPLFPDHFALQVKYLEEIPEREEMLRLLQRDPNSEQVISALSPLLAAIKMSRYADEKEVRLVTFLDQDADKLSYTKEHYEIELDHNTSVKTRNYYIPFCTQNCLTDGILLKLHKIHLGKCSSLTNGAIFLRDSLQTLAEEIEIDVGYVTSMPVK